MGEKKGEIRSMKIFILHGWTYSLEKWEKFTRNLMLAGFNPILLKIPGLTDKIDRPWDMKDYVGWLSEKLKNEKEKVILLGHSNGGRIAMEYSIRHPEKVKNLILIDSAGIYHDDFYLNAKRKIFGIISRAGKKLLKLNFAKDLLYKIVGERDYNEASAEMKKTMVNLLEWEKTFDPRKVKIPTIIIWGKDDQMTPVEDSHKLNRSIIGSKLSIINGAGHSPQFTHSEEVIKIITNNLAI